MKHVSLKSDVTKTVSLDAVSPDFIYEKKDAADGWKYDEKEELGRGGIGKVMVAFDRTIGREIALKELISGGDGKIPSLDKIKSDEARFLREACVTGQLEHPGIVPVYEIGRKPDENRYYTMRLVRGETLSQAIKEAGTLEKRLRLLPHFRDICNAIAYSHSRGVIHRDIKPENIMIGEFGETVVLDWGLAKVKGEDDTTAGELREELNLLKVENIGMTLKGKAIGTPAYMSPEQARGDIDAIDERSDIYSLGAVLYEILTGEPPFKGKTVQETLEIVAEGFVARSKLLADTVQVFREVIIGLSHKINTRQISRVHSGESSSEAGIPFMETCFSYERIMDRCDHVAGNLLAFESIASRPLKPQDQAAREKRHREIRSLFRDKYSMLKDA